MIIAIETASPDVSLALAAPDGTSLASTGWTAERRQGHETLPRLLELLRASGATLTDTSALAVGIGPGSFTGLRVGMSLAKGLALALARPIVGVPSLEAWLHAEPDARAALARAGARDAYLLLRGDATTRIVDRDQLPDDVHGADVVASRELAEAFGLGHARSPHRAATAIAARAAERLRTSPAGDDLDRLEPAYLRAPRGLDHAPGGRTP